ncbi:host cell division inhibitor Icd-like protein, partial [Haemophilus quentini]
NEQQARSRFTDGDTLLFVGRINQNPLKNNRTSSTNGNNHSLPAGQKVAMISLQSEKVIASRDKLNIKLMANDSTPLNRAFFVRNIRTPKEFADFVFIHQIYKSLSMVVCNGQPFVVGCFPLTAVLSPCYALPPNRDKLAVVPKNQLMDTAEMIYKFLCVNRTQSHFNLCVISLNSTTEEQARLSLSADYRFIAVVARINPQNNRTLAARFPLSVNNHSLPKCEDVGSIESTETIHGTRNRNQCAIFLPKIPFNGYEPAGYTYHSELAVRATHGNKAEFIRTNNVGYCMVAVEPLPHPTTVGKFYSLTRDHTMKIYPQNNRTLAVLPTLSVSTEMEVAHG